MKYSAFVPIKTNSTRLPNKNFRVIAGMPLHFWVLDKLRVQPFIDEIIIDTDSPIIKQIYGKMNKFKVLDRPEYLRPGETSMNKIIEYRLPDFKNENIIHTHITNPLLSEATICGAVDEYERGLKKGFDSLFSVTSMYKRMYFKGKPVNHDPKNLLPTQDLIPVQEENAILYLFSKTSFTKTKNRLGEKPLLYNMSLLESVDIDFEEEFILADLLLQRELNTQVSAE